MATEVPLAASVTPPRLSASSGSLKATVICAFNGTPVRPFDGLTPVTCGADVEAEKPVVNEKAYACNWFPARSAMPA